MKKVLLSGPIKSEIYFIPDAKWVVVKRGLLMRIPLLNLFRLLDIKIKKQKYEPSPLQNFSLIFYDEYPESNGERK